MRLLKQYTPPAHPVHFLLEFQSQARKNSSAWPSLLSVQARTPSLYKYRARAPAPTFFYTSVITSSLVVPALSEPVVSATRGQFISQNVFCFHFLIIRDLNPKCQFDSVFGLFFLVISVRKHKHKKSIPASSTSSGSEAPGATRPKGTGCEPR